MNQDQRAAFESLIAKHGLCITKENDLYRSHVVGWMGKAYEAALESQDREDVYIPEERNNYTPSITDCDAVIAQREGYTEGWNDCRQDIINHARRVEGEGE